MRLSKRLQVVFDMIPTQKRIIDVGCDHALLDIYAALANPNLEAIATDISKLSIENAFKNAQKYKVQKQITFMVTDGLQKIPLQKDDVIVITGMGAHTMLTILQKAQLQEQELLLSAHNDIPLLRKKLSLKGYSILDERAIYDGKWYVIILFQKKKKEYNEFDIEFGPFLQYDSCYMEYILKKEQMISQKRGKKTKRLLLLEQYKRS